MGTTEIRGVTARAAWCLPRQTIQKASRGSREGWEKDGKTRRRRAAHVREDPESGVRGSEGTGLVEGFVGWETCVCRWCVRVQTTEISRVQESADRDIQRYRHAGILLEDGVYQGEAQRTGKKTQQGDAAGSHPSSPVSCVRICTRHRPIKCTSTHLPKSQQAHTAVGTPIL